jgi:ferredoxin-NADP reductase
VQVILAADEGGQIVFDVAGRQHGGDDYWDGNWLSCRVSVRARGFRGAFDAALRAEEFVRMREGVRVCMTDLTGAFVFETMEEQLSIVAKGDGIGHFTAVCTARDAAGSENLLTFTLSFDQTRLAPLAAELDELVRAYPVVGKP